jgi:hypothetical protein
MRQPSVLRGWARSGAVRDLIKHSTMVVALATPFMVSAAAHSTADDMRRLSKLIEAWLASPHANYNSSSFTHWNEQGQVPAQCAACHSQPGFIDFLGADGSSPGKVDAPAAINAPVGCASCHTSAAHELGPVHFPSGVTLGELGRSAVCTVCHQGRQSGDAVMEATVGIGEDEVSSKLVFINIHYGVAAAVIRGADVRVGYQYPGQTYAGRFRHVPSAGTCVSCHDPHTTKVETSGCMSCHRAVTQLSAIRTRHLDFDGDGQTSLGIHAEIIGLKQKLFTAIQAYASKIVGSPIGYAPTNHPYFFIDMDGDGRIVDTEAVAANRYRSWTPRLLKAAYNYQVASKDPGGYAHNPTYLLQMLHDSLMSLAEKVDVATNGVRRP